MIMSSIVIAVCGLTDRAHNIFHPIKNLQNDFLSIKVL